MILECCPFHEKNVTRLHLINERRNPVEGTVLAWLACSTCKNVFLTGKCDREVFYSQQPETFSMQSATNGDEEV
jgi:hypothetical protein